MRFDDDDLRRLATSICIALPALADLVDNLLCRLEAAEDVCVETDAYFQTGRESHRFSAAAKLIDWQAISHKLTD